MLPDPTVPASLLAVLELVRGNFTAPTFRTFAALVTGLIAQTGRCTVTGMLSGAGLTRAWSHDRAHTFFSRAAWSPDILGICLSHLIVRRLLPEEAALTVAVDDTLFKRRGKNFRRGLAARRGGQGPQAHRARDLLRRGGPGRRTSFPGPAGVPAGDGSTVAAEAGAVQGRPRRVHAPLPGGLPPRPAHPRRRGRRLPRKVPARVVRELHLHHPVAHQRVAVRPRPAAHRKTRPPSLPTIRRPASATSPARPSGSATRTTRPRPATPACRT